MKVGANSNAACLELQKEYIISIRDYKLLADVDEQSKYFAEQEELYEGKAELCRNKWINHTERALSEQALIYEKEMKYFSEKLEKDPSDKQINTSLLAKS